MIADMEKRNEIARLVSPINRWRNCVKITSGEGIKHALVKTFVCHQLATMGEEYMTEAIFADGSGRCDVLSLDRGKVIEIAVSERERSEAEKKSKYPLPVIVIDARSTNVEIREISDQLFNELL